MSGLYDVYGEEFEKMYTGYEEAAKEENNQSAGVVGENSRIETGMLYKDANCQIKRI
jgi:ribonucleoside-diphosphate reductase alpha chain